MPLNYLTLEYMGELTALKKVWEEGAGLILMEGLQKDERITEVDISIQFCRSVPMMEKNASTVLQGHIPSTSVLTM